MVLLMFSMLGSVAALALWGEWTNTFPPVVAAARLGVDPSSFARVTRLYKIACFVSNEKDAANIFSGQAKTLTILRGIA
jgi:hypothetical protein